MGEPNGTHVWQAIDRGCGTLLKELLRVLQDEYLLKKSHFVKFPNLRARDRRVLFVRWLSEAWKTLKNKYSASVERIFYNSGSMACLSGVSDARVKVESNPLFVVQPFVIWPGLQDQMEKAFHDDELIDDEIPDDDAGVDTQVTLLKNKKCS